MGLLLLALIFSGGVPVIAQLSTNEVAYVDYKVLPEARLHLAYGTTDTEYRQQLLRLTPLGSSYEQVRDFARRELKDEVYPSDLLFDGFAKHHHNKTTIEYHTRLIKEVVGRTDHGRDILDKQAPHYKVTLTKLGYVEGTSFMYPHFTAKPSLLGPWIDLSVRYVFDDRNKLVDLYSFSHGRTVSGP